MTVLTVSRAPDPISPDVLRDLSRLNPWRSTGQIVFEWTTIIGTVILCEQYWHPVLYLVTVIWIGARQHALGILMHDGSHSRILPNKRWNDIVSEGFLAWPIFITMRGYRKTHLLHHRYLNTDRDPDWVGKQTADWNFPKDPSTLTWLLTRDLLGMNTYPLVMELAKLTDRSPALWDRLFLMARVVFYSLVAATLFSFDLLPIFLLYWLIPFLTWFKMIMRIRSIAEHFAIENAGVSTRTTYLALIERLFVAPNNVNYHSEHHLYPGVPFHRLPMLHKHLMEKTEFREKGHITHTYWRVLQECIHYKRGVRQIVSEG